MACVRKSLNGCTAEEITSWYLSQYPPADDHPQDDIVRLITIAVKSRTPSAELVDWLRKKSRSPMESELIEEMISAFAPEEWDKKACFAGLVDKTARMCFIFCTEVSLSTWAVVIETVLRHRHGGRTHYFNKAGALNPHDVARLRPNEIMEKFGVSRSYAYRLLRRK